MRGKQAKILSDGNFEDLLVFAETSRYPLRNKVIVLLSAKAGLRAGEIARLTWTMVHWPYRRHRQNSGIALPCRQERERPGRPVASGFACSPRRVANGDPLGWPGDLIGAGRPDDANEHCGLVCQRVSGDWLRRVYVAFRAPNLHHARCPACSSCRWVTERCPAFSRPPVNSDNSAVH